MGFEIVFAAAALLFSQPAAPATPTVAPARDDTASLQAKLDAGGLVFLPRLPGGECYAMHGLWVSLDRTTIVSDGACIVALGPGPVRLHSPDGDPIAADAILFVSRSSEGNAAPHGVTISGLSLYVPAGVPMFGIEVYAHDVDVQRVRVDGDPIDSVLVGGRTTGEGYSSDVSILDSSFTAGRRNVVSVTSVRGLTIERCVITGASDTNFLAETGRTWGNPAAGIDVEPNSPSDPIVDVRIAGNRIERNAGPGVLLALSQQPTEAASVEIVDNWIAENGLKPTPPQRGAIVVTGDQHGLTIARNESG
jgi:hypothetical protein